MPHADILEYQLNQYLNREAAERATLDARLDDILDGIGEQRLAPEGDPYRLDDYQPWFTPEPWGMCSHGHYAEEGLVTGLVYHDDDGEWTLCDDSPESARRLREADPPHWRASYPFI